MYFYTASKSKKPLRAEDSTEVSHGLMVCCFPNFHENSITTFRVITLTNQPTNIKPSKNLLD